MKNHMKVCGPNLKGRDFVIGDLHGYYDLLHSHLADVSFCGDVDRLFAVGDLCDRGPDSKYVLDYLNEPWFYSVRGNHEEMFISAYEQPNDRNAFQMLYCNGGQWAYDLSPTQWKNIYESFKSLPLAIEINTASDKKVGVIHAECPYDDWDKFKMATEADLNWNVAAIAQWSRKRYDRDWQAIVKGLDTLYVGHTPTESGEIEILGNVKYLDLGSFFRGRVGFEEIK